jgi:hypothetical protein
MNDTNDNKSPDESQTAQPISPTKTATLPDNPLEITPTQQHSEPQLIALSNLAASSVTTVEINAKLAMSATSHETSLSDILPREEPSMTMREMPDFQGRLKPSLAGEELEQRQLERVRNLVLSNKGRAAPQCSEPKQEPQKLHISTSAISLALSNALSTPADTPLTPGDAVQVPNTLKRQRSLSIQQTEEILLGPDSEEEDVEKPAKRSRVEGRDVAGNSIGDETITEMKERENHAAKDESVEEEKKEDTETNVTKEATWSVRQNLGPRGPDQRWRGS